MGFLAFLLLGLIAGSIAKLILPGRQNGGWFATLILGVVGAMLGPELDHFSYPWLFPRLLRSSCVWALILGVAVICWLLISMVTSRKGRRVCTSFFKVWGVMMFLDIP